MFASALAISPSYSVTTRVNGNNHNCEDDGTVGSITLFSGKHTHHLPRSTICTVAPCELSCWVAGENRTPPTDNPTRNTVTKARPSIAPSLGERLRLTPHN